MDDSQPEGNEPELVPLTDSDPKKPCYICYDGSKASAFAADHKIVGANNRYELYLHIQCLRDAQARDA